MDGERGGDEGDRARERSVKPQREGCGEATDEESRGGGSATVQESDEDREVQRPPMPLEACCHRSGVIK